MIKNPEAPKMALSGKSLGIEAGEGDGDRARLSDCVSLCVCVCLGVSRNGAEDSRKECQAQEYSEDAENKKRGLSFIIETRSGNVQKTNWLLMEAPACCNNT
jgi:hypothetical protein